MNQKRLRVLVIAYECSPARSHVAGSAWNIITRLTKWHDLWVVTESSVFENEIQEYLDKDQKLAKHLWFTFISHDMAQHGTISRPVVPIKWMLSYNRWLKKVVAISMKLHKLIKFDLVHHLRTNTFREPGYSWRLPIPFVWGPVGGTTILPWPLMKELNTRNIFLHTCRNIVTILQLHFSPRVRRSAKRASVLIAQTTHDQKRFRKVLRTKPILLHEQACDPRMNVVHQYSGLRPLKIAWVGRCVISKGLHIALKTISDFRLQRRVELHIIGDGPLRKKSEVFAKDLKINGICRWHGWVESSKVLDIMNSCDVLLFSSLLEATSTAVVQALSIGLPVICLKHCGFGDIIDDTCGITIEIDQPPKVIKDFSNALIKILEKPESIEQLSKGACEKSQKYSWDCLAKELNKVYLQATKTALNR